MINKYDLYDISAALINIRNDIQSDINIELLKAMIDVLNVSESEDNQIRKALSTVKGIQEDKWHFVFVQNVYVNHSYLKDPNIYDILKKAMLNLLQLLLEKSYDRAYDLVDSIHCLPDIIADNNFIISTSYWKKHVKIYRMKWDKSFLRLEQKKV